MSMRALFVDLHLDVMRKLMDINFWALSIVQSMPSPTSLSKRAQWSVFRR